ncbi:MAG: hypothetical protein ABGX20_23110 [Bacillus sp. (in: firmicutes)]
MRKYLTSLSVYLLTLIFGFLLFRGFISQSSMKDLLIADWTVFIAIPFTIFGGIILQLIARYIKRIDMNNSFGLLISCLLATPILISGQFILSFIIAISNFMFFLSRQKIKAKSYQIVTWLGAFLVIIMVVFY